MSYTFDATELRNAKGLVVGKGEAGDVKTLVSTVELTAGAAARTVLFGKIPSNARILGASRVYCDDLASAGAPILDLGLAGAGITDDPDAIGNGLVTLATASVTGYAAVSDVANIGKKAYELAGESEDTKEVYEVYGTQTDAATTDAGTITLELFYVID